MRIILIAFVLSLVATWVMAQTVTLPPGPSSISVVCTTPVATPSPTPTATPTPTPTPTPTVLTNQPPGFTVLSDAAAAAIANQIAYPETIPQNVNDGTGWNNNCQSFITPSYFYSNSAPFGLGAKSDYAAVDGSYCGSTQNIIRWAAAKYGVDQVWAQVETKQESNWHQDNPALHGGVGLNSAGDCNNPDGGGSGMTPSISFMGYPVTSASSGFIGPNGYTNGACSGVYASWGVLQTKANNGEWFTWPMLALSTAWNEDYRWAKWRACMNGGYAPWFGNSADYLNAVSRARTNPTGLVPAGVAGPMIFAGETNIQYAAAGCYATHYSGRWYDTGANCYLANVGSCASWFATDNFIYILNNHGWPGQ